MNDMYHPEPDRLEAFVEGGLEEGERVVIESHVVGCPRCQAHAEEWRALFSALAGLPQFEPSAGFADRVMAGLAPATGRAAARGPSRSRGWLPGWQAARGWAARHAAVAAAAAGRVLPSTTRGWAVAVALLALPVVATSAVALWLLSSSYLTADMLWTFGTTQLVDGVRALGTTAVSAAMQTGVVAWSVATLTELLETAGTAGMGALAAAASAATMLSVWVLYRNLFRTPARQGHHATFMF
jgi:hypothetical protein